MQKIFEIHTKYMPNCEYFRYILVSGNAKLVAEIQRIDLENTGPVKLGPYLLDGSLHAKLIGLHWDVGGC